MSDLIHKIVGKIIEVGQSDTTKFRLGETIRYSPSEILEILKQYESEIFGEGSSTQTNAPNTLDVINRQVAISLVHKNYDSILDFKSDGRTVADSFEDIINTLPPAQPEIIYCKDCQLRCEDYYTKNIHGTILYYCSQLAQMIETDFYCGYAERRTDE